MRIRSLDAVRGIAALVVVAHHTSLLFPTIAEHGEASRWLFATPLRLLVAGPAAVYVFFVLSGTVLALPFFAGRHEAWVTFFAKRGARVWVPFAAAVLLSAGLMTLIGNGPIHGTSWWFDATWREPLTARALGSTLAMTGRRIDLDNPMWSLIHEMRIALFLPALMMLVRWKPVLAIFTIISVSAIFAIAFPQLHDAGTISWADTGTYAFLFVVGVYIAAKHSQLTRWLLVCQPKHQFVLGVIALAGLAVAPSETISITSAQLLLRLAINTAAAALLISLCVNTGVWSSFLDGRIPAYLGKVSYSLYLLHVPILVATVRLLSEKLGLPLSVAVGAAFSLIAASAFQKAVEDPAARLSKRLGNLFDTWPPVYRPAITGPERQQAMQPT